jgi:16S rRNA (guanine527-N7)-methyltransferase
MDPAETEAHARETATEAASLVVAARGLGIELDAAQERALLAHLDLLDEWNQRMNLTAIRERPAQLTRHVLDSLTVRPYLQGARIADVGSGAGFPGIPLAVIEPQRHFALIESTGKKCRFLEHVCDALGLANVEVVQARAEACRPEPRYDTVIARAVGPLADLVRYAGPLLATEGRLLAMKGRLPENELAARLNGWKVVAAHVLAVPGLDEQRHLVELVRSHARP